MGQRCWLLVGGKRWLLVRGSKCTTCNWGANDLVAVKRLVASQRGR